jgi:hypothetical protein
MIGDKAAGKGTTHTRTGVHTVLAHTGQIAGTLSIAHTFRLTFNIGIALIVPYTLAGCSAVAFNAFRIDATGRWITRLNNFNRSWSS